MLFNDFIKKKLNDARRKGIEYLHLETIRIKLPFPLGSTTGGRRKRMCKKYKKKSKKYKKKSKKYKKKSKKKSKKL